MNLNSVNNLKVLRLIARIMSALLVLFAFLMFVGESLEGAKDPDIAPVTLYMILQLILFGVGLFGLVLSWKWEFTGGLISFIAFIMLFVVNPSAILWPMFIFPVNAILFIIASFWGRGLEIDTIEEIIP